MGFLDWYVDKEKGYTMKMWIVDKFYENQTLGTGAPTESKSSSGDAFKSIADSIRGAVTYKDDEETVSGSETQNTGSDKKKTTRYILIGAMALIAILYFFINKKK